MLARAALVEKPPHHGTMKASFPFPCLFPRSLPSLALAALLPAFFLRCAGAASVTIPTQESGLSAQVDADSGAYRIDSAKPAWSFAGSLNVRLQDVATSASSDELGRFQQIAFDWQSGPGPMSGWVRVYREKALVLFSQGERMNLGVVRNDLTRRIDNRRVVARQDGPLGVNRARSVHVHLVIARQL